MPLVVQVSIVVVAVAMIVVAIIAMRLMLRLDSLTQSVADGVKDVKELVGDSKHTSAKIEELLDVLGGIGGSLRSAAGRVDEFTARAESITSTVLDEVERPVQKAVALVRGLRAGTDFLVHRWNHRNAVLDPQSASNRGNDLAR